MKSLIIRNLVYELKYMIRLSGKTNIIQHLNTMKFTCRNRGLPLFSRHTKVMEMNPKEKDG